MLLYNKKIKCKNDQYYDWDSLKWLLHETDIVERIEYNDNEDKVHFKVICTDSSNCEFYTDGFLWRGVLNMANWMEEGF